MENIFKAASRGIAGLFRQGPREPTPREMINEAIGDALGYPLPDLTIKQVAALMESGAMPPRIR